MVGFEDGNRITLPHLQLKTVLYVSQTLWFVKGGTFSKNVSTGDRTLITFWLT
jgi:hypothetical protein